MARILVNDYTPQPDRLTGITVYTWKTLAALIAHGAHDYVLVTNRDPAAIPPAIRDGVADLVTRAAPENDTRAMIANTRDLLPLRRTLGCALIYHPQPITMLTGMARSAMVVHDLYRVTHPEFYDWKRKLQWNWFVARGIRTAGAVIAVSQSTADATIAAYPGTRGRVTVIPEASPIEPGEARAVVAPPPVAQPYALVVANIERNKNVGLVIAALKRLRARGLRPRVALVGRDEIGALPALLADAGDVDFIQLGSVSDDVLRALYVHARVYINSSLVEGFCLPILEAQTCGVPVICSDLPVLHEVAGDGARFVDPRDPDDLATALEQLFFDDAANAAMRERGRANIGRFSWRQTALATEQVLDRLL